MLITFLILSRTFETKDGRLEQKKKKHKHLIQQKYLVVTETGFQQMLSNSKFRAAKY